MLAVNGDARSVDYQDELFYLRQAAHALGARDPFRLTEVSLGDERQAPLQEAQVVLLADNSQLDVAFVAELRAFVERGGGLLVSAGPSMDPVALTKSLGDLLPAPSRSRWMALDVDGRPSKQAATTVSVPEDLEFFDQLMFPPNKQFYYIFPGYAVPLFFRANIFRAGPCQDFLCHHFPCRAVP